MSIVEELRARSPYNPNFPAHWTPRQIDDALAGWSAQGKIIKHDLAESIRLQKIADKAAKKLAAEKDAALAWCRANGSPHTARAIAAAESSPPVEAG